MARSSHDKVPAWKLRREQQRKKGCGDVSDSDERSACNDELGGTRSSVQKQRKRFEGNFDDDDCSLGSVNSSSSFNSSCSFGSSRRGSVSSNASSHPSRRIYSQTIPSDTIRRGNRSCDGRGLVGDLTSAPRWRPRGSITRTNTNFTSPVASKRPSITSPVASNRPSLVAEIDFDDNSTIESKTSTIASTKSTLSTISMSSRNSSSSRNSNASSHPSRTFKRRTTPDPNLPSAFRAAMSFRLSCDESVASARSKSSTLKSMDTKTTSDGGDNGSVASDSLWFGDSDDDDSFCDEDSFASLDSDADEDDDSYRQSRNQMAAMELEQQKHNFLSKVNPGYKKKPSRFKKTNTGVHGVPLTIIAE